MEQTNHEQNAQAQAPRPQMGFGSYADEAKKKEATAEADKLKNAGIVIITEATDTKGITIKIQQEVKTHTMIVTVSHPDTKLGRDKLERRFKANRWGMMLTDSINAIHLGVSMAKKIEKELGL